MTTTIIILGALTLFVLGLTVGLMIADVAFLRPLRQLAEDAHNGWKEALQGWADAVAIGVELKEQLEAYQASADGETPVPIKKVD